jgi:primary-amine oxidase
MDMVTTSCTCTSGTGGSDEVRHPLDPLTATEIRAAVQIIRDDPQYGADVLFETIELLEPEKSVLRQHKSGGSRLTGQHESICSRSSRTASGG